MTSPTQGLGVDAGIDAGLARELAARCAQLGYDSLWSNDEPTAPGLETLAHFAAGAPELDLGVGVLPLDRYRPAQIAEVIDRLGLDPARLWIGIGAGRLRPQLDVVRRAVSELRELLPPAARVVVAAMRPKLCRLGGAIADGVLLNWMLPEQAGGARRWVQDGAAEAGRTPGVTASYVRVAVGPGSSDRLRDAEGHYRTIDEGHRRHFAAMNTPVGRVGVAAEDRRGVIEELRAYRDSLDLVIVRALWNRDGGSLLAVAEAAAL
jgi:alkanesulfonate monooxygenase SsuD/methylene tetrahydromethanopterin reductase-like flavin-dependent oxidoreductase (luciferase family)